MSSSANSSGRISWDARAGAATAVSDWGSSHGSGRISWCARAGTTVTASGRGSRHGMDNTRSHKSRSMSPKNKLILYILLFIFIFLFIFPCFCDSCRCVQDSFLIFFLGLLLSPCQSGRSGGWFGYLFCRLFGHLCFCCLFRRCGRLGWLGRFGYLFCRFLRKLCSFCLARWLSRCWFPRCCYTKRQIGVSKSWLGMRLLGQCVTRSSLGA